MILLRWRHGSALGRAIAVVLVVIVAAFVVLRYVQSGVTEAAKTEMSHVTGVNAVSDAFLQSVRVKTEDGLYASELGESSKLAGSDEKMFGMKAEKIAVQPLSNREHASAMVMFYRFATVERANQAYAKAAQKKTRSFRIGPAVALVTGDSGLVEAASRQLSKNTKQAE